MSWPARLLSRILYLALQALASFIYFVPFAIKKLVATALAWLWFNVILFRRKIMLLNITLVFPRRNEESNAAFKRRCEALVQKNMRHTLLMFSEIIERFAWTDATVAKRVDWHGYSHMAPLLEKRKGFFFLSSHLGNWELMTRAGCAIGVPLTVVTRFLRNPVFDEIWIRSRRRFGLELLSETGSGLAAIRTIQKGRALGWIADQHTGAPHGMKARFLGLEAWCPKGLALMSDRLKAPIIPVFILRDPETGRFHVHVEAALRFPALDENSPRAAALRSGSGALNEEGIKYHIEVCNRVQEKWIRNYPEQYLWMHKRFKNLIDYNVESLPWES
ncbi:MAG: lysophospholipid acyltransferase family protein [Bdellovibrionota bacterium]